MRILLAVQGTGNGHISRARDIIPLLQNYGDLDIVISGTQADVSINYPVRYQFNGFSFIFGTHGGINYWQTFRKSRLIQLWRDIKQVPVQDYDLVINDFEPVIAWACKWKGKPCIALSHQSSFLSAKTPRPQNQWNWAEWILKYYAPSTSAIGFHFESYDEFIHTPVIRQEIRNKIPENKGHYTVYLPAFGDTVLAKILKQIPEVQWEVFTKHSALSHIEGNVHFQPIQNESFNESLAGCAGFLTGGGFEGPAEALFLGKKVFSIPMQGQWEQQCNAAALEKLGVPVFWKKSLDFVDPLRNWVQKATRAKVYFPNETSSIIAELIRKYEKNG